jgi:hypothetical protein
MNNTKIGYFAAVAYVASTLFSMFCVDQIISGFPNKFIVLFLACIISGCFFTLINFKLMTKVLSSIINSWKLYIFSSVLIGINWICSIFGVIYSNIFLYAIGYYVFSASLANISRCLNEKDKLSGILFLASSILLLATFLKNKEFALGFMMAILGGATGYLYRKTIFSFSAKELLTPTQIISVRFYPLIFLSLSQFNFSDLVTITSHQFSIIIGFAVAALIIPAYLNQITIVKLGANESTIISSLIFPGSWLINQTIQNKIELDFNFIFSFIAILIIITPVIYSIYDKNSLKRDTTI